MASQVLARKFRPKNFQEMVGQEHIVRALSNALNQQRLHHAYLFTGTRGIGKTTLARILAKCLNCEQGISATLCGKCSACQEIDSGRFVDLIEVDAASRTKVEDTRELLDNVQYTPTRGRFKIYLIDEVHMLSGHSFNALLKTLEEPPQHVKFLLATTDPQKLPVTVLSRCLQFNLKCLLEEQITQQLAKILTDEKIPYEQPALLKLSHAAKGSMRDALSILDQAIGYGNGAIKLSEVNNMLGYMEPNYLFSLLEALANRDANAIFTTIKQCTELAADFYGVLEELITALHRLAILQAAPNALDNFADNLDKLRELSSLFSSEDLQLYYQIALIGRRDLPLAPTMRSGFEMLMLRMLAFQPAQKTNAVAPPATVKPLDNNLNWANILPQLAITGPTRALASHCALNKIANGQIELFLDPSHAPLLNKKHEERLSQVLSQHFNQQLNVNIKLGKGEVKTPARITDNQNKAKLATAKQAIENDDNVQNLIKAFDATVLTDTIKATE